MSMPKLYKGADGWWHRETEENHHLYAVEERQINPRGTNYPPMNSLCPTCFPRIESGTRKPNDKNYMQLAAEAIDAKMPDRTGFILLALPLGDTGDNRLRYISNVDRESAIRLLKEFLFSCGHEEEWMKHI